MINDYRIAGGIFGTLLSSIGTSMSMTEVQAIVGIVVTILGFLITLTTTVIIPIIKKIVAAKKDGKVTIEELEDIVKTAEEGIEKIKESQNDSSKQ